MARELVHLGKLSNKIGVEFRKGRQPGAYRLWRRQGNAEWSIYYRKAQHAISAALEEAFKAGKEAMRG